MKETTCEGCEVERRCMFHPSEKYCFKNMEQKSKTERDKLVSVIDEKIAATRISSRDDIILFIRDFFKENNHDGNCPFGEMNSDRCSKQDRCDICILDRAIEEFLKAKPESPITMDKINNLVIWCETESKIAHSEAERIRSQPDYDVRKVWYQESRSTASAELAEKIRYEFKPFIKNADPDHN